MIWEPWGLKVVSTKSHPVPVRDSAAYMRLRQLIIGVKPWDLASLRELCGTGTRSTRCGDFENECDHSNRPKEVPPGYLSVSSSVSGPLVRGDTRRWRLSELLPLTCRSYRVSYRW